MKKQTSIRRSSKRTVRVVVATLAFGLMASLVPIATTAASAQIPDGELTPSGISGDSAVTPHECFLLLFKIAGGLGTVPGKIDGATEGPVLGGDENGRYESYELDAIAGELDRYRDLGCANIPGFPDL